ncbi:MAG: response regulator [Azospirillaceae bacterium]|nr:response regulator [Azospirillaceae bacterium]
MSKPHRILVIEDEVAIRRLLRAVLTPQGWTVVEAATAQEGLVQARLPGVDLVLLDLGLPDGDGLDLVGRLKAERPTPVIILSSRDQEDDKVAALDLGADDYVTKPFGTAELMARIRAALRHAVQQQGGRSVVNAGGLEIDLVNRHVSRGDEKLHLSPTEFDLLRYLAAHAGKILTHRQILKEVWGPAKEDEVQYLRVYIRMLRQKIESDPNAPGIIQTEPGIGYRLVVNDESI